MNKQDIARTLIELTVEQTLKGMKENPHRSIRRLADLGRQFAKGRFQEYIFTLFQNLLDRDDSPYYDMIERLLSCTNKENLKTFGINVGYNCWTYGAATLRANMVNGVKNSEWYREFSWTPSFAGSLTLQDISTLIAGYCREGTYFYHIKIQGPFTDEEDIFDLFASYPDCAFVLSLPDDCSLTPKQLSCIRDSANLLTLVPTGASSGKDIAAALLKQGSLFAVSHICPEEEIDGLMADGGMDDLISYQGAAICLIPAKDCSAQKAKELDDFVYSSRMEQRFPTILVNLDADIERVNNIIFSEKPKSGILRPVAAR